MLEEARQDEASMAALETELESSEQRLADALEDSANLRAQLKDRSSCSPAEGHNHDLTVRSPSSSSPSSIYHYLRKSFH